MSSSPGRNWTWLPITVDFVDAETCPDVGVGEAEGGGWCPLLAQLLDEGRCKVGLLVSVGGANTLLMKQVSLWINSGLITVNGPLVFLQGTNHAVKKITREYD